ncbi:unnamed protein product [Linum tenue]|uniref:Wbp11/ELF5/Saf1 N-terminal domain-containing protein n=1 Tax=Linum tenue TaxID=586396 RepID=A0AAV0QVC5_9ROSI|nr:unnamed protein product [Linum tenue]
MVKTTKGGKVMNPTDAYRKELRKKELKRNKKERKKVREVGILKKDPDVIKDQIHKLESMKADGALDKARKHKKRQLEDTLTLVMKKRKDTYTAIKFICRELEYNDKMKEKGETPVMFSHLGPPRRRTSAEEEERAKHPQPEDSVYYHPTLNPTGAPPPGKPPMYKSSIGPRIPLSAGSTSGASSSKTESEDGAVGVPPLPLPPPPPLPESADVDIGDGSVVSTTSMPLAPPPPQPPAPSLGMSLPPLPLPPPPPGPPPTEDQVTSFASFQPPPPGTNNENEKDSSTLAGDSSSRETVSVPILQPPPPPGMPMKLTSNQFEVDNSSESDPVIPPSAMDGTKMVPPPPPPRQQPLLPGPPPMIQSMQPDLLPPAMGRFPPPPPPPPPGMRPHLAAPGLSGPPVGMVPMIPRPPYGPPPGPPPMMRPPLPPGPPPGMMLEHDIGSRFVAPQKPSYVKSAASTVVKRPLAQHTPELTAMVPASVRVRRETAAGAKPKPKATPSAVTMSTRPVVSAVFKPEPPSSSAAVGPKGKSVDDSYSAFLEDMKALGALDS